MRSDDIKRFWSKVDIQGENECWNWKAGKDNNGYGIFSLEGKPIRAHRVAFFLTNSYFPTDGNDVCHAPKICHSPSCCNPAHLSDKTHHENMLDKNTDGTMWNGGDNRRYSDEEVTEMRDMRKAKTKLKVIAQKFKTTVGHASDITLGKRYK